MEDGRSGKTGHNRTLALATEGLGFLCHEKAQKTQNPDVGVAPICVSAAGFSNGLVLRLLRSGLSDMCFLGTDHTENDRQQMRPPPSEFFSVISVLSVAKTLFKEHAMSDLLPTVNWNGRTMTRLLIGHNPVKGTSHRSTPLDAEMKEWHLPLENRVALLDECERCGINTAQFGAPFMHETMAGHAAKGGQMQWIATFYGNESGDLGVGDKLGMEEELRTILNVNPKPIGIQHFGEKTDRLVFDRKFDLLRDRLKRIRDTGVLVGVCTHLPQVGEEIVSRGWDIDFLQASFYSVYSSADLHHVDRDNEVFRDEDRDRMVAFIKKAPKPCLAFKVLGSSRKCESEASVREALTFAYANIKPTDVVLVGMWQKHANQVERNCAMVREILA